MGRKHGKNRSDRMMRMVVDAPGRLADSIRSMLRTDMPVLLTARALATLASETGGYDQAFECVRQMVCEAGRPVMVNFERPGGESSTMFIFPDGWSEERQKGWVGGLHSSLEREFGTIIKTCGRREGTSR
jgi:hypothetical protein